MIVYNNKIYFRAITHGVAANRVGTASSPILPRMADLANNGGFAPTHAPLAGSPVLDAGDNAFTGGLTTDQRGPGFSRMLDAADPNTVQAVDGTLTYRPGILSTGVTTFTVGVRDSGGTANGGVNTSPTQTFTITIDGTPPTVTDAAFFYQASPHRLAFKFSENVGPSLSAARLSVRLLPNGPTVPVGQPSYDPVTNTATFSFDGALPNGNYRATLLSTAVNDVAGNRLAVNFNYDFFSLAGDANHDRSINFSDLVILAQNYGQPDKAFVAGDFNYNGSVGFEDLVILAQGYNTTLAPPSASAPEITAPAAPAPTSAKRAKLQPVFNVTTPVRRPKPPSPTTRRLRA